MTLEDHLGDVIRKARKASGRLLTDAARAAELSEPELSTLEETGEFTKRQFLRARGCLGFARQETGAVRRRMDAGTGGDRNVA